MRRFAWLVAVSCVCSAMCLPSPMDRRMETYLQNPAVKTYREYIQIDTSVQENIPLAVEFWKREAAALGLPLSVHSPAGKPIVVITWAGANPGLPSIMLNSHMDVVNVEEDQWTYPAFMAEMDDKGDIYGRGTQDAKDVSIQYLEAVRRLMQQNVTLQRTLHITLMPDEETGGYDGMNVFRDTEEFKSLNPGFVFDEGSSSIDHTMYAVYQDKRPWQLKITVHGDAGHGSTLAEETAETKLHKMLNKIHEFRDGQLALMKSKTESGHGWYTSVNVNVINGGVIFNVIPSEMYAVVDIRWATHVQPDEMGDLLNSWTSEAGNGTTVEYYRQVNQSDATILDGTNPYWVAIQDAAQQMNITILPFVMAATSDAMYLRNRGYPCIGFAPKTFTTPRMHDHNEYLNVNTFLKGIDVYVGLLKKLGNI